MRPFVFGPIDRLAVRIDYAWFMASIEMHEAWACMGNAMKNREYTLLRLRHFFVFLWEGPPKSWNM